MEINLIWEKITEFLKKQLSQESYDLWIKPLSPISLEENKFTIQVPNKFFSNWIKLHHKENIENMIAELSGIKKIDLAFKHMHDLDLLLKKTEKEEPQQESQDADELLETSFNPKYSFENFIEGPSNRFAKAACFAAANNPGKEYNPIFLYGGVGLGKTHLLHSIGNKILKNNNKAKVLYITAEKFINEFIESLTYQKPASFRNKFRNLDCLLIDDIQFLTEKQRSQEEFFNTFNALYDFRKQILITSDRPPKELQNLEERLISRFEWGVIADVKPPDLETRIAILRKKAEGEKIYVPDDVILFLASQIKSNIRKLEGSLIRIVAFSSLTGTPLTVDTAKEILSDIIRREEIQKTVTIEKIQKVVARHYHLDLKDMRSKKRTDEVAFPRQTAMYLARSLTERSTIEIGEAFGGKDHTTVLHAWNKIKTLINTDPFFAANINKLVEDVKREED
ncbi:MAG: chromosomal replication initiator protein DnaA [Elusimicrobia bacterium]|nr:chromosomal replication initiator protein DnaA [Elusimicrobiota bacterium]MBU2614195.1 chromosomal replication initiator protein DnaA [Elusimicrobiota bacterium]